MKIRSFKALCRNFFESARVVAVCALLVPMVFVACSKDDKEEEGLLFLDGSPVFYLPIYAAVGDTVEVVASGVITEGATYSWTFPGLDTVSIASDNLTAKILMPDSLASFQVTLTADAGDEYYSSSYTQVITVLGEGTLTGTAEPVKTIVDERDSRVYPVVEIGNLEWFAANLNWAGAGEGYGKTEAAASVLGRLYTWNDATGGVSASGLGNGVQGVCPEGWSIPTHEDWEDLAMAVNGGVEVDFNDNWLGIAPKLMANAKFNGEQVWPYSPEVTPTNKYGWNALASGSCLNNYNNFYNIFSYGIWWSSTERDSNTAYYKYIYSEYPNMSVNYSSKDGMGVAVRCVRLKENN